MFQDTQQPQSQQPVQATPPEVTQTAPQASPAPVTPPPPTIPTTQEERIWAAIAYVGFLGLLTLAMKPKSEFCKKHAAQGLFNFSAWFILLITVLILLWPFPAILLSMVESLLFFATLAVAILGIVKALQSYELNIPVFSAIALKFPVDLIIGTITGKAPEKPITPQDQPPANTPPPPTSQTPQQ